MGNWKKAVSLWERRNKIVQLFWIFLIALSYLVQKDYRLRANVGAISLAILIRWDVSMPNWYKNSGHLFRKCFEQKLDVFVSRNNVIRVSSLKKSIAIYSVSWFLQKIWASQIFFNNMKITSNLFQEMYVCT